MSSLRPILNHIVFQWVDKQEDEFTVSGIVIQRKLDRSRERWGQVTAIGPNVTEVKVGDYILPEKTHEPFGANWDGHEDYWMTYEKDIMLVTDDRSLTNTLNGSEVLFDIKKKTEGK